MAKSSTHRHNVRGKSGLRDAAMDLNPAEQVSRERWCYATAAILSQQPWETVRAIVAGGRREFRRVAIPILQGHAFRQTDIDRIYDILKAQVDAGRRADPRVLLGPAGADLLTQ